MVVSQFIINTPLQRGVLRGAETQNRFNGFYAVSKTAEAVRTILLRFYTQLKQGVNDKNPLRIARFVEYSGNPSAGQFRPGQSHGHDFFFLMRQMAVDLGDVLIG